MLKRIIITVIFLAVSTPGYSAPPEKVWGASVPAAYMIYIVNPERLAGWPSPFYEYEAAFIPEKYKNLPMLGSWHGGGGIPDKELLVKNKVKTALILTSAGRTPSDISDQVKELGMDIIRLNGITLKDYISMFRTLGKELGVPERGEELAAYAENALAKSMAMTAGIPEDKKLRVFVAEGNNGLSSSCVYEELDIAGAVNAYKCPAGATATQVQISFEQIIMSDPDVILIQNPFYASRFEKDPKWSRLRAYREGRVYVVPYGPFGWMDKPIAMKYMAVQWLACTLYPDRCSVDIEEETGKFMELFLHTEADSALIKKVLHEQPKKSNF